jgi:DNA-directed RNA polymerase specialized sigma24 family protein
VWVRFCRPLIARAAAKLGPAVRGRVSPEDVVQSCFRTFFRRAAAGEFVGATDAEAVFRLLMTITTRRALNARRYQLQKRRSARLTVSGDWDGWEGLRSEPTPGEQAEYDDLLATLKDRVRDDLGIDRHREIAELTFAGRRPEEIAAQLGCAVRTVFRVHARMREVATQLLADPDPPLGGQGEDSDAGGKT